MVRRIICCSMSLALLATPLAALGDPGAEARVEARIEARQHFDHALELVDAGELEEAVVEFRLAYNLKPHFAVLYNLGQAYVALGKPVEAIDALTRYLEEGKGQVPAARRKEVDGELARQRERVGEALVDVEPVGATVAVDGKEVGQAPISDPVRLSVGDHDVSASFEGFEPATSRFAVVGQQRTTVTLQLHPVPTEQARGLLSVSCSVPDVVVRVDGVNVGNTPLARSLSAVVGPHRLSFRRVGYVSHEQGVTVAAGATVAADCAVTRVRPLPPEIAATLSVRATETGARVEVDGTAFSFSGPLPAGRHTVRVTRTGFRPWTGEVMLKAGRTSEVIAKLRPEEATRRDYEARARRQRTWSLAAGGGGAVLGLAALGTLVWNGQRFGEWEDEQNALSRAYADPQGADLDALDRRQATNDDLKSSIGAVDGVTAALGIAGGALLATGAYLFFTGDDPGRYRVAASAAPNSAFMGALIAF